MITILLITGIFLTISLVVLLMFSFKPNNKTKKKKKSIKEDISKIKKQIDME